MGISARHLRQGLRARLGLLWQLGWHPYCCLLEGSARVKEHGYRHEAQRQHTGLRATMKKGGLSTANHSMAAREHGTMFGIEMTFDPLGSPSRQLSSGRSFCQSESLLLNSNFYIIRARWRPELSRAGDGSDASTVCRIRREVWRKVCDGAEEARQPRLCVTH